MTPVGLQKVLSVGTGTFVDETIPRANKVDIRVLWIIKQLSYKVFIFTYELFPQLWLNNLEQHQTLQLLCMFTFVLLGS